MSESQSITCLRFEIITSRGKKQLIYQEAQQNVHFLVLHFVEEHSGTKALNR